MPLGPVFDAELRATARRGRYYGLRFGYGAILLGFVAAKYRQLRWDYAHTWDVPTHLAMATFAQGLFEVFSAVQAVAVLALTPALVAGTIADERRRRTLHDLLASELTGVEIVLGKLAARLLHVLVFLVAGLPVLGLIGLFGGIEPGQVALATGGAASTAFFLAGLSIFASATSRRPGEALGLAYLLGLAWFLLPPILDGYASGWGGADRFLGPALGWWADSGPAALIRVGPGSDPSRLARMIGLQLGFGALFVALAVGRLRPSDRAFGRAGPASGRRRWVARPIGDDPMLWKECRVGRAGGPLRVARLVLGSMALASLAYVATGLAGPAFAEVARYGYGRGTGLELQARGELHRLIGLATFAVALAWSVSVATSAAAGLTSEREGDTWLSLVGTPLGGHEILRAKRVGAFLRPRASIAALLVLWSVGVAAGAIHPLGLAALAAELVAVGAFLAALGTLVSLRSRTSARALATTLVLVLAIDVGGLLGAELGGPDAAPLAALSSPLLLAGSCLDHQWVRQVFDPAAAGSYSWQSAFVREGVAGLGATLAYALGAVGLAAAADRSFDRAVDRPRRPARTRPGSPPAA